MYDIVRGILSEVRPEVDFNEEVDLAENGFLDSFDIILLVSRLDDEFSISIPGSEVVPANFKSIDSICALIERTVSSK